MAWMGVTNCLMAQGVLGKGVTPAGAVTSGVPEPTQPLNTLKHPKGNLPAIASLAPIPIPWEGHPQTPHLGWGCFTLEGGWALWVSLSSQGFLGYSWEG